MRRTLLTRAGPFEVESRVDANCVVFTRLFDTAGVCERIALAKRIQSVLNDAYRKELAASKKGAKK